MQPTSLSLLNRIRNGLQDDSELRDDDAQQAWKRLHSIYAPLVANWLRKQAVVGDDADDLAQDVLLVVLRKLPSFEHNGRAGAFRRWLRLIVINCSRDFWKAKRIRPRNSGDDSFMLGLDQLADETSGLTQRWNQEHDLLVMQRLLEQLRPQFQESTWLAFERTTLEERPAASVAKELGVSVATVYTAKSRVLSRLRQLSENILD
ncbi:MAG: sigma-70 family RNA polymerase sigma factor [Planctomycetota bacterium]